MKKFYSILISLLSVAGYSQTILHQTESTTRTVQDPQTVIMAPGFRATSGVSNPFVAKIGPGTENPGGGPADSQAGANNPSGTTAPPNKSFHDTKGNIEVDGGGQLQFTLPIALPPGVKSVAPQINLIYSSSSGNGIAGYGWNLSGITAISREGKNIEKDGEVKSIQLDYSDYYTFNGQRLILKSGEYGKDGAEYVTEKYSNIKIKSFGNMPNWKQPEYWEVTFEDGSQAWYGGVTSGWNNATNRLNFNIVKWKDAQGNTINYTYEQESNVSLVKSIKWGGNEALGTSSFNEIVFNYIDRNLVETTYINGPGTMFMQSKLLKDILVTTNGNQFKKYSVEYISDSSGYQYAKKITESNSQNEAANPVVFNYPPQNPAAVHGWNISGQALFDNIKFTGDFNGDSYLDFVMNDGTIKLGAFNDDFNVVQTNKIFNSNSIVVNTVVDETGQVFNGNGIAEYNNSTVSVYVFRNNSLVKVFEKYIDNFWCPSCDVSINEGDIDGDGISDLFIIPLDGAPYDFATRYLIDLKKSTNPIAIWLLDGGVNENLYTNQKYVDVDGDGKIDIIDVSGTSYTVFEFVKYNTNQYLKKIKFSGNLIETKGDGFPVLFGDFNGDGKLDFTIPVTQGKLGKDDWRFYIGTGKSFNSFHKPDFLVYRNESSHNNNGAWLKFARTMYSISDLNGDGKSDIVQVYSYSNLLNGSSRTIGMAVNSITSKGAIWDGTSIEFEHQNIYSFPASGQFTIVQPYDDLSIYQPITNAIRSNNNYYNVFLYRKGNVVKIKAPTGVDELKRIESITQGDITTSAKYLEVVPDNTANPNFYKKTRSELYPYFSLTRVDKGYAISQLLQEGRKQDFRYRGMTVHMQGRGIIGYHQAARSSWYADGFENTKIWSGVEIDPLNEGMPTKEWSIRTNDETKVFPADISVNNTQLLSFKSTIYQTDMLLNGQVVTTVADVDKPKTITAIIPKSTKTKNFLTGIEVTSNILYGDYYLPLQTTSNVNNGFAITTSNVEYTHNLAGAGADYFVGRLKSKSDVSQAYGDTKSVKEEYAYENNQLKTQKTWNRDNTGYILETYNYDNFGNLIQKIISNSIDSHIQEANTGYDDKGRFVIKKTDNLGLETNITYNGWGQILTQTDPLGNTLVNTYDAWGKLLTSKTNLGGTTTYQYERDNNSNIVVTQNDPDGNITKKFTNKIGQNYRITTKAYNQGQFVSKDVQYDVLGRKINESEPYFDGQAPWQWNVIAYDDNFYPTKLTATAFTGKQVETTISGLTTTVIEVNNYNKTTTKTADALGNIILSTDKGGSITFSYSAAGEQIKAQYAENIVTTKYDSWGRKSEFNDPSNGLYKYEYNGFGQAKKIISPKGTKEYTYNNLGQLTTQKELSTSDSGETTNKLISFTYDNKGRVISKSGTSKGKAYSSNILYDPQGRVLSSSENSNGKHFIQKGITYDDKARVISYEKQLYSSGVLTKVQIENVYSPWNGQLSTAKDKNSGRVLWVLQTTNAKGQVLGANLGRSRIINSYDNNGFLTNIDHRHRLQLDGTPSILQVSYSFDAVKNELSSRITGGDLSITETFDYDDNNRLVNWTNPRTGQTSQNTYDVKGRITHNDQVGTVKFENSAKIYQPTGMTLNAAGTQNYNNDLIQSIVYNENNDPVFIDGEKGDVAFQYGLTSMRQRVTYGGNFNSDGEGRLTKFYSEDGSFEVVKDNSTGKEKHLVYVGGNPYESNIVYVKNFDDAVGSYKFLHKDYLGSILAISDEDGNKLEQRHYDAWGNFTHLKIGNGSVITDKNIIDNTSLLTDRGYTSHEYFAEVGIIHMNGRLYDPMLRRFLNADENIQDPYNTQNYNKYGYVLNNPLMYNDPSGEFAFAPFVALIAKAAFSAVVITAATYTASALIKGNWTVSGFFRSISSAAITGMVSGALSFGVGTLFQIATVAKTLGPVGTVIGRAGAHSVSMGALSTVSGGKFWSGAASGAFSSLSGDLLSGIEKGFLTSNIGKWSTGMASGGIGSVLAGGNFWKGAMNGFFVMAFNHMEHALKSSSIAESELRAVGVYDPHQEVLNNQESLSTVLSTKTLSEMHVKSGNVDVEFGFTSADDRLAETTPNENSDRATGIIINVTKTFTYYTLYATVGHELKHAIDYIMLTALNNYKAYFKQNKITAQEKFEARHEYNAWKWEVKYAPSENARLWVNYYKSKYGWKN